MKRNIIASLLFTILLGFSASALAWERSIALGYGYSHDPNHTKYNNSGFLLSSDLLTFWQTNWTTWSVMGSLGRFHSTTPQYQNVTTGALSLALRFYPFTDGQCYPFYLYGSAGPALLSSRYFGYNKQAKNISIQTNLGIGQEFNNIDVNLRLEHFSNAGLAKPNEGFNILYLLSIGYLF